MESEDGISKDWGVDHGSPYKRREYEQVGLSQFLTSGHLVEPGPPMFLDPC